jgi:hypothetical protein
MAKVISKTLCEVTRVEAFIHLRGHVSSDSVRTQIKELEEAAGEIEKLFNAGKRVKITVTEV